MAVVVIGLVGVLGAVSLLRHQTDSTVASVVEPSAITVDAAPPLAVAPFDAEAARLHQRAWADYLGVPVEITNSIGMKLVLIPPGEFEMGSTPEEIVRLFEEAVELVTMLPPTDVSWYSDTIKSENPRHRVVLTQPFYMGSYEVTMGQFCTYAEATQHELPGELTQHLDLETPGSAYGDDYPASYVTWHDARAFCEWLSDKESRTYTLPTEAQWEYACRGGTTSRYISGDEPEDLESVANIADASHATVAALPGVCVAWDDRHVLTAPVGQFVPNAFGLYDVHGNVWEWCADWFSADYYAQSPTNDPPGPTTGKKRVVRGGAYSGYVGDHRSACRRWLTPSRAYRMCGFRVVAAPLARSEVGNTGVSVRERKE